MIVAGAGVWPKSLAPFEAPPEDDYWTLREPDIRQALEGAAGFDPTGKCAQISGELLRRLLIALEGHLKGRPTPLSFRDLVVKGPLKLNDLVFERSLIFEQCHFLGPVQSRMLACRSLALESCRLDSHFDGRVMSLRGNLFLRKTIFMGPVLIRDCTAEGVIDCGDASFLFEPQGVEQKSFDLEYRDHHDETFGASRIRTRSLFWTGITISGERNLTLYDAEVGSLRDDLERGLNSWPAKGCLKMRGFNYVRKQPAPYDNHLAWLELDPDDFQSNGRVLVGFLEASSRFDDATKLKIEIRERSNRVERSRVRRWSRGLYLFLQRQAFRPGLMLLVLLIFFLAAAGLAFLGHSNGLVVPTDGSIIANGCFTTWTAECRNDGWVQIDGHDYALPRALQFFSPFAYAFDLIFPYRPGASTQIWGGANILVSLGLLVLRIIGLALQASLAWSLFGNRDNN